MTSFYSPYAPSSSSSSSGGGGGSTNNNNNHRPALFRHASGSAQRMRAAAAAAANHPAGAAGLSRLRNMFQRPSQQSQQQNQSTTTAHAFRHHGSNSSNSNFNHYYLSYNYYNSYYSNHKKSPTFWIGTGMFCLVIFYMAIVVTVTRVHIQAETKSHLGQMQSMQYSSQSSSSSSSWSSFFNFGSGGNNHNKDRNDGESRLVEPQALMTLSGETLRKRINTLRKKQQRDEMESVDQQQHHVDKDLLEQRSDSRQNNHQNNIENNNNDNNNIEDNTKKKQNKNKKELHQVAFGAGVKPDVLIPLEVEPQKVKQIDEILDILPIAMKDDSNIALDQHPTPNNILTAYLEPLNYEDWEQQPLPYRQTAQAAKLQKVTYPRLNSCRKFTQQFPVDDTPADADPFLPWIHDVFPTADGTHIQFVAQNKRRCRTGSKETDILMHMQPQVALFQHVPVKRIFNDTSTTTTTTRYQIVPDHAQADPDGIATRFICRFKPGMQETLSVYNLDYDWTSYRKQYKTTFAKEEGNIKSIHTSQLIFQCPVPLELQETIRTGASVGGNNNNNHQGDDYARLFVDLIPIRTAPRYGIPNQWFQPMYQEFQEADPAKNRFHPVATFGQGGHLLPPLDDSGRWENIPICKPSLLQYEQQPSQPQAAQAQALEDETDPANAQVVKKKHHLVSCIWASAGYATRGNRFAINDGQRRLLEWMTHNHLIGFDHFYVYDNTGAFRNDTSLKPVVDLFPPDMVTYIPWPATVCNNNPNNVDSVGERSSQYAAESSCRLRFGPHVDWIGQFDIDEYLIPMGPGRNNILTLLNDLEQEDTRIISFGSWRAWPRWKYIAPPEPIHDKEVCWSDDPCFHLSIPLNHTMLQAYNCDRQPPGQKTRQMPAEKQIYRPDYVLQHFVHYSAATIQSAKNRTEWEKAGYIWKGRAFPDPRQRFANELTEGLMIHTKAVAVQDTVNWEQVCHIDYTSTHKHGGLCRLGVPWPHDVSQRNPARNATDEGWAYNCFVNEKVETMFVPQLQSAIEARAKHFIMNGANQQQ